MARWIAALVVVLTALAFTAAQDDGERPLRFPFGSSKSQIPFEVIEEDGKTAWRVTGRGTVRAEELLAGYATATDKRITYDASATNMVKTSIPYIGPDGGMVVSNAELGDYVSELLEGTNLTLVGHRGAKARVVHLSKVHGYADVVDASALSDLPETEWVTVSWNNLGDAGYFAEQLQRFDSAMVALSAQDSSISATGRVAQLRNVNRLIEAHFATPTGREGMQLKTYNLTGSVKAVEAQRVLNELFTQPSTSISQIEGNFRVTDGGYKSVFVSIVSGSNRLLVRATGADHELVKAAITAMQ